MEPEEQQVIQVKYKSLPFGRMSESALLIACKTLLIKLHVITGWAVPEAEFRRVLEDQLQKKMIESYPEVNADEMEYAFRNNPGVQDYGKAMNLNLIDEVMQPYLVKRRQLSDMEERLKAPPKQKLAPIWQLDLEIAFNNLKRINKLPCQL